MFIKTINKLIIRHITHLLLKNGAKNGATGVQTTKKMYFCTSKGKSHGLV